MHYGNIVSQHESGVGNMGSLDYGVGADQNRLARFSLPGMFTLSSIRGHFSGGTGYNDLIVNLDSRLGLNHDFGLETFRKIGTGGDELHLRIPKDEYGHWTFWKGDVLVITWTNPGSNTWGLEVLLIPIEED